MNVLTAYIMNETVHTHLSDFLSGKLSPEAFTEWVVQTPELKELIAEDDYQQLAANVPKQAVSRDSLEEVLRKYVDWAQYEKEKLAETLMAIIWNENPEHALIDLYQRYSRGQRFLYTLGLKYGRLFAQPTGTRRLRMIAPPTPEEREALLQKVYPQATAEAKRLLGLLVAERIQFTGTYTSDGHPEYVVQ
jgi:hypothetical protein